MYIPGTRQLEIRDIIDEIVSNIKETMWCHILKKGREYTLPSW
jgi:predicted house-cleaning noncanonical NTP pyrophosphatase (MazG superfamily)